MPAREPRRLPGPSCNSRFDSARDCPAPRTAPRGTHPSTCKGAGCRACATPRVAGLLLARASSLRPRDAAPALTTCPHSQALINAFSRPHEGCDRTFSRVDHHQPQRNPWSRPAGALQDDPLQSNRRPPTRAVHLCWAPDLARTITYARRTREGRADLLRQSQAAVRRANNPAVGSRWLSLEPHPTVLPQRHPCIR